MHFPLKTASVKTFSARGKCSIKFSFTETSLQVIGGAPGADTGKGGERQVYLGLRGFPPPTRCDLGAPGTSDEPCLRFVVPPLKGGSLMAGTEAKCLRAARALFCPQGRKGSMGLVFACAWG